MFATKETAGIAACCMVAAWLPTQRPLRRPDWPVLAGLVLAALIPIVALGPQNIMTAVLSYSQRAMSEQVHRQPFHYYAGLLLWSPILCVLAVVGRGARARFTYPVSGRLCLRNADRLLRHPVQDALVFAEHSASDACARRAPAWPACCRRGTGCLPGSWLRASLSWPSNLGRSRTPTPVTHAIPMSTRTRLAMSSRSGCGQSRCARQS